MKLHTSVVDHLAFLCTNHGGHAKENKLLNEFRKLHLSLYQHRGDDGELGEPFLVLTDKLVQLLRASGQTQGDIQVFVLHGTAVEELMKIHVMWDGYPNQYKLKKAISNWDLSFYERKLDNVGETVLVPTAIYQKALVGQ